MNKLELIVELAKKQGISKPPSTPIVDLFFDAMAKALCYGGRVEIRGLCALHVKKYRSYTGRDFQSTYMKISRRDATPATDGLRRFFQTRLL